MEKPKLQTITFYDYYDCRNYIEKKLGIEDLQDVNGYAKKHKELHGRHSTNLDWKQIQDFDEYVEYEFKDGEYATFKIYQYANQEEGWWTPIIKAFHEEFGENATYSKD